MLANDVQPSRLEQAKDAIAAYTRRHVRGRVGIIGFAGSPFLECPLTLDYDAFHETLRAIDPDSIGARGTNVRRALEEAHRAFQSSRGRRTIVMVSDGEDFGGDYQEALKVLMDAGIKVFTLGTGTEAGSTIPVVRDDGTESLLTAKDGGPPVESRLVPDTLIAIARETGADYRTLKIGYTDLEQLMRPLLQQSTAQRETEVRVSRVDRYRWPVALALCLLIAESFLGTRRNLHRKPANA
jgi:Ca-activated chloride channel family protein